MEKEKTKIFNVCVATVTYNRKEYLLRLLNALSEQTHQINTIYIVDNHSEDGTMEMLFKQGIIVTNETSESDFSGLWKGVRINYHYNDINSGGSGGFEQVFKMASANQHDFLWAMDDDVLPERNCLEILLSKIDEEHKVIFPSRTDENFTDYIVISYNLTNPFVFKINGRHKKVYSTELKGECVDTYAFPLEGPLFSMDIVRKIGYPDPSYFIMYDDSDYARRCLTETKIRYVKSACLHKQIIPVKNDKFTWKEYYGYRNCFLYDIKYGKNIGVRKIRPFLIMVSAYLWNKYKRHNCLVANTVKIAYKDAISGKIGKTVEPGKLEEYLEKNNLKIK